MIGLMFLSDCALNCCYDNDQRHLNQTPDINLTDFGNNCKITLILGRQAHNENKKTTPENTDIPVRRQLNSHSVTADQQHV